MSTWKCRQPRKLTKNSLSGKRGAAQVDGPVLVVHGRHQEVPVRGRVNGGILALELCTPAAGKRTGAPPTASPDRPRLRRSGRPARPAHRPAPGRSACGPGSTATRPVWPRAGASRAGPPAGPWPSAHRSAPTRPPASPPAVPNESGRSPRSSVLPRFLDGGGPGQPPGPGARPARPAAPPASPGAPAWPGSRPRYRLRRPVSSLRRPGAVWSSSDASKAIRFSVACRRSICRS